MTVIIIIVGLVLSAFNYEPWWFDTKQKDNYSAHVNSYNTQKEKNNV